MFCLIFSLHVAAKEECESSQPLNRGILEELRSSQNEHFSRLVGVLTGSFLGLQKTLSELMTPLSRFQQAIRPYPESNTESDSIGIGLSTIAAKANARSCSHHPSAIAVGKNLKHANRTSVHNISKGRSVHTATSPEILLILSWISMNNQGRIV